jgi:hypothetical protein
VIILPHCNRIDPEFEKQLIQGVKILAIAFIKRETFNEKANPMCEEGKKLINAFGKNAKVTILGSFFVKHAQKCEVCKPTLGAITSRVRSAMDY